MVVAYKPSDRKIVDRKKRERDIGRIGETELEGFGGLESLQQQVQLSLGSERFSSQHKSRNFGLKEFPKFWPGFSPKLQSI
jgi:hypothetical protein